MLFLSLLSEFFSFYYFVFETRVFQLFLEYLVCTEKILGKNCKNKTIAVIIALECNFYRSKIQVFRTTTEINLKNQCFVNEHKNGWSWCLKWQDTRLEIFIPLSYSTFFSTSSFNSTGHSSINVICDHCLHSDVCCFNAYGALLHG